MSLERFRAIVPDLKENEPMSRHTSFKIGGPADMYASVTDEVQLKELILEAKRTDTPYLVIGNGSNMLVSDKGIRGLVIQVAINYVEIDGMIVRAGAGALMSRIAAEAARAELTGFETFSGIPGTLGGGIFMNAGAYGGELKNVIRSVRYMDEYGDGFDIRGQDCEFGYRTSVFSKGAKYIISAEIELEKGNESDIRAAMADYNKRRSDKQPLAFPSAGSVFKRPEGYFAGALIEAAGLKGYRIGGAEVSELHAGFIVNRGGATASDVLALVEYIKKTVMDKSGVMLEPEIRLIGEK